MSSRKAERDVVTAAFEEFHGHIYRFLLRRTGNHHDAEELAQRVFVDAAESLANAASPPDSVLAYLYTIAERRFIDEMRRRKTARDRLWMLPMAREQDQLYKREVATALRAAIEALPGDQRSVVVMKLFQGRAFSEIAEVLGISVDACKMRLSRAVARIRVDLAEHRLGPDE